MIASRRQLRIQKDSVLFLSSCVSSSQIWLNYYLDDRHFGYLKKSLKKNPDHDCPLLTDLGYKFGLSLDGKCCSSENLGGLCTRSFDQIHFRFQFPSHRYHIVTYPISLLCTIQESSTYPVSSQNCILSRLFQVP